MASLRQNKVARLIQRELGAYLQQNANTWTPGAMVSITVVRMSPDLGVAKVYLSIFPNDDHTGLKAIQENVKSIRHDLGKKLRHQLKRIPELIFYLDDSLDYSDRIEKLI